jgi:hypothetical protein
VTREGDREVVQLTRVTTELEAAMICGLLREHGIECAYEQGGLTGLLALGGHGLAGAILPGVNMDGHVGPQQILVHADNQEAARAVLAAAATADPADEASELG